MMFSNWVDCYFKCPGLYHIFIRLGPARPNTSFIIRSSCPHLRGESSSLGTNVTRPGQNYKYPKLTSLTLSPSSPMEFLHMPKKLNGLSDRELSHWFPMRKNSHTCGGKSIPTRPGTAPGIIAPVAPRA
jgi:hypothetical protein